MHAKWKRLAATVLAAGVVVAGFGAAPAMAAEVAAPASAAVSSAPVSAEPQAAGVVAQPKSIFNFFVVYYGPDCVGGNRTYYDPYFTGQPWIHDVFTDFAPGGGYGELIRNNAASIRVYNADIKISSDDGLSYVDYNYHADSACFNLGAQRNQNTDFLIYPAY